MGFRYSGARRGAPSHKADWARECQLENLRPGATIIPRWVAVAQRNGSGTMWGMAFRREIVKWAILISMIVFVITLKDRAVETLLVTSFLLGLLVNSRLLGVSSSAESA